jgi:hypothetical protein
MATFTTGGRSWAANHPGCGCRLLDVDARYKAVAAAAAAEGGAPLNWVGPPTAPARESLEATAAATTTTSCLDSSHGVGAQFEAAGLTVHCTEDQRALTPAALAYTKLLVILKDSYKDAYSIATTPGSD